ncbi:flagellar protein FlaG [Paenibacillus sp. Y412MC10]|uniref:flagellar protein FlaG n=1 Tax=Geobacillus sp. (strain Y412MC10) TaxID=481743 RepID=UPI0021B31BC8|nr:flagellar protein FlaG [Paenibacillus sp. Y412MC10]
MDNRISGSIPMGSISPRAEKVNSGDTSKAEPAELGSIIKTGQLSADQELAVQQLEKAIRAVQGPEKSYEIKVHKETHTFVVKIFNKETGDLIREIPQEKLLDVATRMMELNGIIVDKRA